MILAFFLEGIRGFPPFCVIAFLQASVSYAPAATYNVALPGHVRMRPGPMRQSAVFPGVTSKAITCLACSVDSYVTPSSGYVVKKLQVPCVRTFRSPSPGMFTPVASSIPVRGRLPVSQGSRLANLAARLQINKYVDSLSSGQSLEKIDLAKPSNPRYVK